MNRIAICASTVVFFFCATSGQSQVAIEILDAPSSVFSYEPAYVVFEVRNEGDEPVVIPVGYCFAQGVALSAGRAGEPLRNDVGSSTCGSAGLVWLAPGERRLFFHSIGLGAEGAFELQATLRSPGQCAGRPLGPEEYRIVPTRPVTPSSRPYDCWSGEATSRRSEVLVEVPTGEADLAAAEFLVLDHVRWRNNWKVALTLSMRDLYHRFPTSHYTYAAFWAAGGGGASMLNVTVLQPDNALNHWVAGAVAASLAYRDRPCANPEPWGPRAPADLDERFERVIAEYPPPAPVQAYLRQLEVELAAEDCSDHGPEDGVLSQEVSSESTSASGRTDGDDG